MAERSVTGHLGEVRPSSEPSDSDASEISTIKKELEFLERTWRSIEATLSDREDSEEAEIQTESGRQWMRELRHLAYEIDDLLHVYQYEVLSKEVERIGLEKHGACVSDCDPGKVRSPNTTPSPLEDPSYRREVAARIKEINKTLERISTRNRALKQMDCDVLLKQKVSFGDDHGTGSASTQQTSPWQEDPVFCGREEELPALVQLLRNISDSFGVIAVVGMGGVGKTTLVQQAFNHPDLKGIYDLEGWVCVSDSFDSVKLTCLVVGAFRDSDYQASQLTTVQNALAKEVRGKTFLLVMDDVWNEDSNLWNKFLAPFRNNVQGQGSKIIITTRIQSVAKSASAAES